VQLTEAGTYEVVFAADAGRDLGEEDREDNSKAKRVSLALDLWTE
jgi:hypothetical protein